MLIATPDTASTPPEHPEWTGAIDVDSRLLQRDLRLFASTDIDEVRSLVGRVIKPHQLSLVGGGARLDARMHHSSLAGLEISRLKYGPAVRIQRTTHLNDFFLVQMPLNGATAVQSGARRFDASVRLASVLNPHEDVRMDWSPGSDLLMLRLSKSLVERRLASHIGQALDRPLEFELDFDWKADPAWLNFVSYLAASAPYFAAFGQHPMMADQLEQMAAGLLLSCHRHNYSDCPRGRGARVLPRHVRRAQEYLHAHAHEPINADCIAENAGVSVRSLYLGFRDFLGTSPMQYLRDYRLEKARADLTNPSSASIAGVAHRWGFTHMGRFSAEYKRKFGESPSETLRRA